MSEENKEVKNSKENIEAALTIAYQEFFLNVTSILSLEKKPLESLEYHKMAITLPNGGVYLLSVLHVDGPTLNLKNLAEVSESENKKPQG